MPGLSDLRNQALDKYDDDLNPIEGGSPPGAGLDAAPAAPEGMPMEGEMPPMEDELGAAPGGGEEVGVMSDLLAEAGIQAAPEEVEAFVDLLKDKAMQMAGELGGEAEAGGMPPAEGGMPPEAPPAMV